MRDIFRASNKIFSNLCQNIKGFNFVFEKLGLEKLLELARNSYDETIIDAILEMIINFINNNHRQEIQKYLTQIFACVVKGYKVYDNNREMADLLTKAVLIVGLLCDEESKDIINQFDFVKETCKFDMKFLLRNLQFLNALTFALGKVSCNNPKVARSCFETGIIYKINNLIEENLKSNSNINFAFFENLSILFRNILKNNFKIIPKFIEKNPLFSNDDKSELKISSNMEITGHMLYILQTLLSSSPRTEAGNITIYNLCEAFESLTMDDAGISHLVTTNFINVTLEAIAEKQSESEIVKIVLLCLSNYFNKEVGANLSNIELNTYDRILQILRGIQTKKIYYQNADILMLINSICYSLFNNLSSHKDAFKPIKESLFDIIVASINIQDWNTSLLLNAIKIIYQILNNRDNKYLIDKIFEDTINTFLLVIRNNQNNSEILIIAYDILSLFADKSVYGYSMINKGLLDLIKDTLIKLATKCLSEDNSASSNLVINSSFTHADLELKQVLFALLEKLSLDNNNSKKIADVLTENLIIELKNESTISPGNVSQSILKLFKKITSHPGTVESFLQQNGLECVTKLLKTDPMNFTNDINCLGIINNISKNGNNFKKKLKEAKCVEIITDVIDKTKNVNKEISLLGGIIINDINDIQVELQKVEDTTIEEVKKKNSPIKPEIKNFLINGKIMR